MSFIHPLAQTCTITGTGSEYTAVINDAILPEKGDTLKYTIVKQSLSQYDEIMTKDRLVIETDNNREVQEVSEIASWTASIGYSAILAKVSNQLPFLCSTG